jgi:TRAP-type transport system small permease protein
MRLYSRFLDVVEAAQSAATVVAYIMIIVIVTFQVLNRFWLQWPIIWTADLAVITFIWLGFLTASTAVRRNAHFRMSALIDALGSGLAARLLEIFAILVMFFVIGILIYYGTEHAYAGLREVSPGLGVRMVWAYAAVPVTSITAFLFAIERLLEEISGHHAVPRTAADAAG